MTLNAVLSPGNPNHPNTRVSLRYDETMGVPVFVAVAPLCQNEYAAFSTVKEALTGDQYRGRYPIGATTLTDEQLWDKDYIIKYDNDLYMIGDHTDPTIPLGIAQYLNCAMRLSGSSNNCKLVQVTINNQKMYVAKVTARIVNVGEQLFTPYGKGRIIPKHTNRQSCLPSLLHTTVSYEVKLVTQSIIIPKMSDTSEVEELPHTAPIVPKHYGYSTDSLWEITICIEGPREMCRIHMSLIRNPAISEEEAATYLLNIPEKIFKLHIKSTDKLSNSTVGDGSCGFRILLQASKRAAIQFTSGTTCLLEMWTIMTRQNGKTKKAR